MRLIIILLLVIAVSACARPVGDFGRAKSDLLHDEVLPSIGSLRATASSEPVSYIWTLLCWCDFPIFPF